MPDHDRDENCRRANVMTTYCMNVMGSYSEVTPPKNGGGRARSTAAPERARNNEESKHRRGFVAVAVSSGYTYTNIST